MNNTVPNAGQETYTLADFLHGRPETMIQADQQPKVLVVWPHGDETLGPRVGYHIYSQEPELLAHVDYICGNPLAASQNPSIRNTIGIVAGYTAEGTDLNRSFTAGVELQSYEQHRAAWIMDVVGAGNYDYILDLHTTHTGGGRYFLISESFMDEQAVQDMIAASPINNIVVLPDKIARDALIGITPNSVSIEYTRSLAGRTGVQDMMVLIHGLVSGQPGVTPRERMLYYVSDAIPKDRDPGLDAKNFQLCKDGYYPVLFGAKGYRTDPTKTYLGFAAARREIIML